jgi:hypothetical protein
MASYRRAYGSNLVHRPVQGAIDWRALAEEVHTLHRQADSLPAQDEMHLAVYAPELATESVLYSHYFLPDAELVHKTVRLLAQLLRCPKQNTVEWQAAVGTLLAAQGRFSEAQPFFAWVLQISGTSFEEAGLVAARFGWPYGAELPCPAWHQANALICSRAFLGAAYTGRVDTMRHILSAGYDLHRPDWGFAAALLAAQNGQAAVLDYLRDQGIVAPATDETAR